MKCLSMMQPWAWLILQEDLKDVENRGRGSSYRGPCLIHASKTYDNAAAGWIRVKMGAKTADRIPEFLPAGALVGRVDFTALMVKSDTNLSMGEQQFELEHLKQTLPEYFSPWFTGPYGYVRKNPVMFKKPIPYRGLPSLFFEVPNEVITAAERG